MKEVAGYLFLVRYLARNGAGQYAGKDPYWLSSAMIFHQAANDVPAADRKMLWLEQFTAYPLKMKVTIGQSVLAS